MPNAQVIELLSKSHLFRRVRTSDLELLADQVSEVTLEPGEPLYAEGQPARGVYLIRQGKIRLSKTVQGKNLEFGCLQSGDALGLDGLLRSPVHQTTAAAVEACTLICFEAAQIIGLARQVPRFQEILYLAIQSRQDVLRQRFDWLEADEFVYHVTRQHPLYLVLHLLYPFLAGLSSILFFLGAAEFEMPYLFAVGFFVLILSGLWGVWFYLDYFNDYYVVTNQRVVWIEKIIGIYDSRQEAPMTAIRSVDYTSRWLERIFGMGDLLVRTFTGSIALANVRHATYIIDLLEEQRERAKKQQFSMKQQSVRQIIRQQIGLEGKPAAAAEKPAAAEAARRRAWNISFRTRLEQGSTVTFRKHWVILVSKIFIPALAFLAALILVILGVTGAEGLDLVSLAWMTLAGLVCCLAAFLWMVYHYVDWRNDIYMVTGEQILDIERRPLGKEQRKAAPLENILSLSVERKNIVGVVLNFGDVIIDAGGTKLIFKTISDPTSAQLDITRHVEALRRRKEEAQFQEENRRLAEWLSTYHRETHI